MGLVNYAIDGIKSLSKREPAVIVSAVVAPFVVALVEALQNNTDVSTWAGVGSLALGVLIRQFVVSPATSEKRVANARRDTLADIKAAESDARRRQRKAANERKQAEAASKTKSVTKAKKPQKRAINPK